MLKGFKEFLMRGNVLDLAVAFVIGVAFTAIINAVVNGLINPLVAAIFGKPNLAGVWNFTLNGAHFSIGLILAAVFNFICVAAAIYFLIVLPVNKLNERRMRGVEPELETPSQEVVLLTEIRDALRVR
ncbi:large conductance mechanosensitive channel protein MscL [Intrasporangium oryzae]|uniref:large conductance mechanosensitive channel protein MscL n=1 Tax=Intrasporangium oryzae TaxID=412687 RepID=UPI0004B5E257|nr:large conductance mechanosensitive channel protein MscL [Intrasporangium oryzae]